MTREDLTNALKLSLEKLTLVEFSRLFINEVQAIEEFYKLCNDISAGKTISLLFNPHRLSTGTKKDELSVFNSLTHEDRLSGLARLYLYNLEHGVNNAFYNSIQRGYQNVQYVNEFPPYVARQIYKQYCRDKPFLILDPCAGWGGRMIGAASLPNSVYVACEPSTDTYLGLLKLGEWLMKLQPSFKFEIYNIPYEDFEDERKFNIALTSPPYYDTEHYSTEATNSFNKFPSFDKWINGFYKPLITNTVNRLTDNAMFILNIGDRQYNLSDNLFKICNDNGFIVTRISDYLSGNGEGKEKFYCISATIANRIQKRTLF